MKYFIKRLFVFGIILTFILIITVILYFKQTSNLFTQKTKIDYLILGDSHFQNGINSDKYIPSSLNLACSGETYFNCYTKLKFIINNNTKIKNVVLSLGPHNLSAEIDTLWIFNKENFLSKIRGYAPIIYSSDFLEYINKTNFSKFILVELVPEIFHQSIYSIERQIILKEMPFLGGFVPNNKRLTITDLEKKQDENVPSTESSKIQLYYLQKIADMCKENNIQLILVNSPIFNGTHVSAPKIINEKYYLIDLGDIFKNDSDLFADLGHLNKNGSDKFSKILAEYLTNYPNQSLMDKIREHNK